MRTKLTCTICNKDFILPLSSDEIKCIVCECPNCHTSIFIKEDLTTIDFKEYLRDNSSISIETSDECIESICDFIDSLV